MKKTALLLSTMLSFTMGQTIQHKFCYNQRNFLDIPVSSTIEGRLNAKLIYLADQIERNLPHRYKAIPIAVTSFVNLNKMDHTNRLGRLIAENLQHELQVRGWHVIDVRLTKSIIINKKGEFILSRDIDRLKLQSAKIGAVLSGTYTTLKNAIIINARLIQLSNAEILSSAQIALPIPPYEEELYDDEIGSISITK